METPVFEFLDILRMGYFEKTFPRTLHSLYLFLWVLRDTLCYEGPLRSSPNINTCYVKRRPVFTRDL